MSMPWTARIITVVESFGDFGEGELVVSAYHLEDLVVQVQIMIEQTGLFRIEQPIGLSPVSLETWANMLSRNYGGGEPEEPYPYPITVNIRNGGVIIQCGY